MPSARKTYVISVRDLDGPATVEEVRTGRKARLSSIREIAGQLDRWLRDATPRGSSDSREEG